jgi:hypothetical protein
MDVKGAHPTIKDSALCKFLRTYKKYREKYGHYNLDALRKIVRNARSPKHNITLRYPEMNNLLDACERNHGVWNEELTRRLVSISLLEEKKIFSPERAKIARDELAHGPHDAKGSVDP